MALRKPPMILKIGSKGFSLVEVIITVAILSIGITVIIRAFIVLLGVIDSSQTYMTSLFLAKEKMSEILLVESLEKNFTQETVQGVFQSPYKNFKWETQISPSDNEKIDILTVKVTNEENNFDNAVALLNYVEHSK